MAHFHNNALVGASGQGGYLINQSLRFNSADSAYLNRTPATTTSRTTWTWSAWIKRGILTTDDRMVFSAATSLHSSNPTITYLGFNTSNQFVHYSINNGSLTWNRTTSQVFRDVSGWYHIVCVLDTSNATAGNRVRVYVNGTEVTAWATDTTPSQNAEGFVNLNTATHKVGQEAIRNRYSFDGYLAEVNFIDGTALTPSSFGETDTITGAWIPKKYSGSYGTNGFYLNFSDNSGTTSTTLGKDSSGNGNNWTPNNFSVTAGAGNDVLSDSPTNNWCTLNPLLYMGTGSTKANGNLQFTGGGTGGPPYNYSIHGTFVLNTGKWYWEVDVTTVGQAFIGIFNTAIAFNGGSPIGGAGPVAYGEDGKYYNETTGVSFGNTYTSGNVISVAVDFDANLIWFAKNGTWQNSGVPASSTNGKSFGSGKTWGVGYLESGSSVSPSSFYVNFGQRAFAYTPPTGFKALNTANLPEPTIKKGGAHFNTVLWTGNGTARSITGLGFSPDFVWIKERNNAVNHLIFDNVRGSLLSLTSNNIAAEVNYASSLTSFDTTGFSLGTASGINDSSDTYVAWAWDANGAGSSNTAGTITSTVSANATAGFSIVTYTGTGSNATVGHGLGVAPSFYVVKNRNTSDQSWYCYHKDLGASYYIYLNLTAAAGTGTAIWNGAPSSSVFTLGTSNAANGSTMTYVAYCFSEVAGYSKFGSYTGNGSSDGPFVFCGFRPAFIMIKRTDTTGNWTIHDNRRLGYNGSSASKELYPNLSNSEGTDNMDQLSNGFKLRDTYSDVNASGGTYIFAAFSETAFKYSNAR